MSNDTTVKFRADISQLKSQMQAAERQIKLVNSEFKAASAGMDDWTKSADGLSAKTKQLSGVLEGQNKKLELMEKELKATVEAYGENSAAADRVRIKINEQKAAIANTESQLKKYSDQLEEVQKGMDKAADGADEFISATDKLKSSISDQESKLESLKKHYADLVAGGDELSDEAKQTAREISELSTELKENKDKLADAEQAADQFDNSLEEMDDSVQKASDGFSVMKGALADLVADGIRATIDAIKDFAKATFEVGSNFESAMSQVQAVSGASADEMEQLTAKAEEMGAKTKFSATESADAFNYMAMAGWKTEDMLDGIEGIMNLAAASGADLATTSDIVTDALTAMGYEAKDAGKLADVMAAAASNANTNVEMMGGTFQYVAPVAGALGYKMEDTAVAIGLMANSGIKAEKAGTALRSIFTRLSTDAGASSKKLGALGTLTEKLGVEFYNADGTCRELNDVLVDARAKWADLTEEQQVAYGKTIAGQEALSGWLALMNSSDADFNKLTNAINDSAGAAENMANVMNDNVNGQITLLKSKIEGIMIKLFNRAKDSMRSGIETIGNALDKIDWDKVGDAVGKFTEKAADLFAYVVNNSGQVKSILRDISLFVGTIFVTNKITTYATAISGLVNTFMKAQSATDGLANAFKILGINMNALPVLAVVGAGAALYSYMEKQEDIIKANAEAMYGLSDAEKDLINNIENSRTQIEETNAARREAGEGIDLEYNSIESLKNKYNELIDENGKVKYGYEDFATTLLEDLADALGTTVDNIKENIDVNGQLGASIDELIQKKKAEAKIALFESDYKEALKNELSYFRTLKDAKETDKNAQENLTKAQEDYNDAIKELEKFAKVGSVPWDIANRASQAGANLEAAKDTIKETGAAVEQAAANWGKAQSTIENYQKALTASTEGTAEEVNDALISIQYGLVSNTTATKEELQKQYKTTQKDLEAIEELYENGGTSEALVKEYRRANKLAGAELDKWVLKNRQAGTDSVNELNGALNKGLKKVTVTSEELGVGSKLALFEGLGDWREIAEDKAADYTDALGGKAGAAENAGKDIAEAAADGAKGKKGDFKDAAKDAGDEYDDTLNSFEGTTRTTGGYVAKAAADGAKEQLGEFTNTAEEEATTYVNILESHNADYKKTGEQTAITTANGAANKMGEFKSAGEKAAEQFTITIDGQSGKFKVTGQNMADSTAEGASDKADAMEDPAEKAVAAFADYIDNNKDRGYDAGSTLASEAVSGADSHAGEAENSGKNLAQGFINGIASLVEDAKDTAAELVKAALKEIKKIQQEGSPSKVTYKSGTYFSQGYINGIKSLTKAVGKTAANVGKNAVASLKKAQKEGSPSKLTYQSGQNFTQGYINGIASLEKKLLKQSKNMVTQVVKQLKDLNNYNFSEVAEKASSSYSSALEKKMNYTSNWMNYKNEKLLADFDKTIDGLKSSSDKEVAALQKSSSKVQAQIQKNGEAEQKTITKRSEKTQKEITKLRQAEQNALQKEIDKIKEKSASERSDDEKKKLKSLEKELKAAKELEKQQLQIAQNDEKRLLNNAQARMEKELKAEQKALESGTKKIQKTYNTEINRQQKMKEAYQRASSELINSFSDAMSEYQDAAQELIDSTMDSITTKYEAKYDALISKQNDLIDKLKSAGDLFNMDDVNLMTTADLKAQTEQITRYANKLKKIKGKVSDELFAQIQSYDAKDSEAFVDRLLKMSSKELKAYNKAYTEKLNAANELAEGIYEKDFEKVAKDYKKEIDNSFKGLDKELEELGRQCLVGFVSGLTTDTAYMDKSIRTFVDGMIDTFKDSLGIASPSKVTKKLGAYTAEGFALGIESNSNKVTSAVDKAVTKAEKSFNWSRLSLIDGFSDAMASFESQAREVLTSTVEEIGKTYQAKASEVFSKQEALADKLKESGSLFDISSLNLMTTEDLKAQTAQIKDYGKKLTKIKDKVSSELFEQISSYDMQDGEAFIDRLLKMSAKELKAYNDAYTEKLKASDKMAQKVYAKELDSLAKGYNKEIEQAFKGLDQKLYDIGQQCLSGFAKGLTDDSQYINKSVSTLINGMIKTICTKLGIKSPSRVLKQLGAYTIDGFALGIEKNSDKVTTAIDDTIKAAEKSFNWSRLSLVDGFSEAIADFEGQARDILTSTIEELGDTYQTKASAVFSKQESLAKQLKESGSLFDTSNLNLMTTEDLKAQTAQIKDYANKLTKIKSQVSDELFEQISSYDMKDGEVFIDRLLSMSAKELKAYNDAYTEKLKTSDKLAQKVYASELDSLAKGYNEEITKAFNGLDEQLQEIGAQCLKGFTKGLTGDTKYISNSVSELIDGMISTFKKKLGIASPSKVTRQLGVFTVDGFADGISQNTDKVTTAIDDIVASAEKSFNWSRLSLVDGFSEAMSSFESQAREILTSTIEELGETYQNKANDIFTKQDNLAKTLQDKNKIFSMSNANLMTTQDLQRENQLLTSYGNKLTKIKDKVSSELFEQISSYDMKDGEAFIDRLLSMSAKELSAYDKAYTDKLTNSEKIAQTVYTKELDKLANEYNAEIVKVFNGLDDKLKEIGSQCVQGFAKGLTSDTKYISNSVNELIDGMIADFKKRLQIASPSKVLKKLGAYTTEGFALGISQNTDMVTKAVENMVSGIENSFDWSRLSLLDGFTSAISEFTSEAKDALSSAISEIGETYQAKFDEILSKQSSLKDKLKETGELFTISNANVIRLKDINTQISDIETYAKRLEKIKGKVSSALFEQITSYNTKEGSAFIEQLLSMSDKELKAYSQAYDKKLSLSEQLSESLYKSDLDKVANEYDTAIEKAFASLPASLQEIGTQTMQGFLKGLGGDASYFTNDVKKIVNSLVNAFKNELGIHSPSKVMEELGEYTIEGFADGLMSMVNAVKDAAKEITDTVTSSLDWQNDISGARDTLQTAAAAGGLNRNAGTYAGANTQIINFNQTNNSPKALDRLTLYRQTNNMLFGAKVRLADV